MGILPKRSKAYRALPGALKPLIGYKTRNPELFALALRHASASETHLESNERLEFLGDAVLELVVSDMLYNRFPHFDEGKMTRIRSGIVSRRHLKKIAAKCKLVDFMEIKLGNKDQCLSPAGNAMEALIGAIYLDKGYRRVRLFVLTHILTPDVFETGPVQEDCKSQLNEWAQKNKHLLTFITSEDPGNGAYQSVVLIDEKQVATAHADAKKKAEQKAAELALKMLDII